MLLSASDLVPETASPPCTRAGAGPGGSAAVQQQSSQITDSLACVLHAKKNSFTAAFAAATGEPFLIDLCPPVFSLPKPICVSTAYHAASSAEQNVPVSPLTSFAPSSPDSSTFSDVSSFNDDSHNTAATAIGNPALFSSNDLYFSQSRNSSFASSSCLSSFSCFSNTNDDHPLIFDDVDDYREEHEAPFEKTHCHSIASNKKPSQQPQKTVPSSSNGNLISSLTKSLKLFSKTLVSSPSVNRTLDFSLAKPNFSSSASKASPVPLKTFKVENTPLVENWDATNVEFVSSAITAANGAPPTSGSQRAARASPLFLRMYAIGNTCQQKSLIPNIFDIDDCYEEEIQEEHDFYYEEEDIPEEEQQVKSNHSYYKLGMKAKLKLYDNIKLQPRSDSPADNSLRRVKYIKDLQRQEQQQQQTAGAGAASVVVKSLVKLSDRDYFHTEQMVPWISYDDVVSMNSSKKQYVLNTHGVLKSGQSLSSNYTDAIKRNQSNVQFTVKGYVNPRWVSSTSTSD